MNRFKVRKENTPTETAGVFSKTIFLVVYEVVDM